MLIYELLSASIYEMKETIANELTAKGNVEFYTTLGVKMANERFTTESPVPLSSHFRSTSNLTELNNLLDRTYDQLADKLEVFEEQGWRVKQLVQLTLHFPHRVQYIAQALDGVLQEYRINLERREQTVESIFEVLSRAVYEYRNTVVTQLRRKHGLKIIYSLHLNFHQSTDPSFITEPPVVLNTEPVEILASPNIKEMMDNIYDMLIHAIEEFEMRGSGWVLDQLLQ